jgi:hypothetical protein
MATFLVCGDRHWTDERTILSVLHSLKSEGGYRRLIHGDCVGADKIGGNIGQSLGFEVRAYPADWKTFGRAAGPIRNRQMVTEEPVELVLAFHNNLTQSKGTKSMIEIARKKDIPVILCSSDGTREILG